MITEHLTHKNYFLYCAKHYDNPQCVDVDEFRDDLSRIKYIKKLITRYEQKEKDNSNHLINLILNHIITLYNLFGADHLPRIVYLKMKDQLKYITPYLILLNCMPDKMYNIDNEEIILTDEWPIDIEISNKLRDL